VTGPVLELSSVSKNYGALRPLRIDRLVLGAGEHLAILGLDQPAAEILINLVTGATLPDRGEVVVFGRSSDTIRDSTEWLTLVDRFGIVTDRAVLLEGLSVVQNLAVPFTLDIEPPTAAVRHRAVAAGREVGLADSDLDRPVAQIGGSLRLRLRLARALALDPSMLVLEHPTAGIQRSEVLLLGRAIRSVVERRGAASLTLTADPDFATAVASRVLTLAPATGRLSERRRWFGWQS
jgi:ABC-type transporter Mla maintaining outer membrane lipid asymmetry ATPase subunit MlaF